MLFCHIWSSVLLMARARYTRGVVTSVYWVQNHVAAMLEVYLMWMWTTTELKCGNMNIRMWWLFVYLDWGIIPRVCKHAQIYDVTLYCNVVYLQHGDGIYCGQDDTTVTPCVVRSSTLLANCAYCVILPITVCVNRDYCAISRVFHDYYTINERSVNVVMCMFFR